jgi:sporulation protein YlmC with PRC-barrel domain
MLRSLKAIEAARVNPPAGVDTLAAIIRERERWTDTILGYGVQGCGRRIGEVEDLILDLQTTDVRYLVINAYSERSCKLVLLSPNWTTRISWGERTIFVDFSQQVVDAGPAWDQATPLTRDYETRLHSHYGRPPYWARGVEGDKHDHCSREDGSETSSARSHA